MSKLKNTTITYSVRRDGLNGSPRLTGAARLAALSNWRWRVTLYVVRDAEGEELPREERQVIFRKPSRLRDIIPMINATTDEMLATCPGAAVDAGWTAIPY